MVEDMAMTAKLFVTSSKLHHASLTLAKLARREGISGEEKKQLREVGSFLREMDWSSPVSKAQRVAGGFGVHATTIRPTFYSCLFRIAPKLLEQGLRTDIQVMHFLTEFYRNLHSPGSPGKGHRNLSAEEWTLGALLLHEIAESLMVQLSNNGLPRQSTSLKEEWKPTANALIPAAL